MEIAIIGAGNVGKALAKSAVRAGHKVTLSSANPEHAEEAARATGAKSAPSNVEAVKDTEIVIVAVAYDKVGEGVPGVGDSGCGQGGVGGTHPFKLHSPPPGLSGPSSLPE